MRKIPRLCLSSDKAPLCSGSIVAFLMLMLSPVTLGDSSNYGITGLINIPSAFMADDGTFTTTISSSKQYDYYNLTYQALPWLETAFRYRKVEDVDHPYWSDYYDRNFAAKFRLIEESHYFPQVSFGLRDFVGTGLVGSEYLVSSKRFRFFDLTLGIGWGDLAGDDNLKNPFTLINDRFEARDDGAAGGNTAGTIPTGSAFQGKTIGWFGGARFHFQTLPLDLLIERNPEYNRYDVENFGVDKPTSRISLGLEWQATPQLQLNLSSRGDKDWSLKVAYRANTDSPARIQPLQLRNIDRALQERRNQDWYTNLLQDMENTGLLLYDGSLSGDQKAAYITIGNSHFRNWGQAITTTTNLADLHLPQTVHRIDINIKDGGYITDAFTVTRPSYAVLHEDLAALEIYPERTTPKTPKIPDYSTNFVQKKLHLNIGLTSRIQLFDPEEPVRYGVGLSINTSVALPSQWLLHGKYIHLMDQNFDESIRRSNSILPHVRTDIVDYLKDTDRLHALYIEKKRANSLEKKGLIKSRYYFGILEEMYMGAGGEFIYQPHNSRISFGSSYAWVKQRAYNDDFGTRDYQTFVGFISIFWDSPIKNYDVALHAGRYLAKDKGATIEINRTFNNGWSVGAWATKTNVSSQDFGEGSFDKGISLRIPFGNKRSSSSFYIRPVQRDGGQMLYRQHTWPTAGPSR